ncbi:MAG: beta-galactosidase trimerization domain-containing protein [Terriglobia bacterium]
MNRDGFASRRSFLRVALAAPVFGVATGEASKAAAQAVPVSAGGAVVSRVKLDGELYDSDGILHGEISFRLPASSSIVVRWMDSFGRIVDQKRFEPSASGVAPQSFSFEMARGLTYRNWIRVSVDGAEQAEGAQFLLSPRPLPWTEFHVIMWAHYPDGYYDMLRKAGVDGTIAYRDNKWNNVLDNDFNFYVEQMAWEVFSIYQKDQPLWRSLLGRIEFDRNNLELWVREPCVNDPKTDAYLREHLTHYVRMHRAFRPLFYNIADELGQAAQIRPNDFCHSKYCVDKFAEYLRRVYGPLLAVENEWSVGELTRWDDDKLGNGVGWARSDFMAGVTTTDRAFDRVAVAGLRTKYGSVAGLNRAWGTTFPARAKDGQDWGPILAVVRETRSVPSLAAADLEKRLGSLVEANARWGNHTTWAAPDRPTNFTSWSEVSAFVKRYYNELSQVRSTEGWNVSPWCDFRNFMDLTFADAVGRARAISKAEDPHARCSTEGGQSPFAFGWYNYENVVRVIDVIEPYNGGNNVEVIRSLNPAVIMVSTHGYEHRPQTPLTQRDRLYQKRAVRPIWWGLFHGHRGALIWDDLLPEYRFVDAQTRQLTPSAETFAALFNELHDGIGMLFINSRRLDDGIAIHYSQASMQVHWLLDNVQNAQEWMLHSGSDRYSHMCGLRNSWTKLMEDLGLQYVFVGRREIEGGKLNEGRYRAFIMPQSLAISPREAAEIHEFVHRGGMLIADYRAASMNDHGRDLGHGQLDDVFGITHVEGQAKGQTAVGRSDEESLHLQGKQLQVVIGDDTVSLTTGKALAASGSVPLVIVNDFGQGKAVFLNLEMAGYAYERLQPNPSTSLPELMEGVFGLRQIEPQVRVLDANGKRLRGTEIVRFANDSAEHVAIFRNPQFDDAGWGSYPTSKAPGWAGEIDNSILETPAPVTIAWPSSMYTYDIRGRQAIGNTAKHAAALEPWGPLTFTRSPQPIPPFHVDVPAEVSAGTPLVVTLTEESELPAGMFRVLRLEFFTPGGHAYGLYARNLMVNSIPYTERIPLALSDPKGRWRLRVRDVMTGQMQDAQFNLV